MSILLVTRDAELATRARRALSAEHPLEVVDSVGALMSRMKQPGSTAILVDGALLDPPIERQTADIVAAAGESRVIVMTAAFNEEEEIALLKAGPLEIVKVGRAQLTEEAWWRYGRELTERKRNWDKLGLAGTIAAGAVVAGGWATGGMTLLGVWLIMGHGSETVRDGARWLRFGSAAWRGDVRCEKCGHRMQAVPFRDRASLGIFPTEEQGKVEVVARVPVRPAIHRDRENVARRVEAVRTQNRGQLCARLTLDRFERQIEQLLPSRTKLIARP